MGRPTKHDPDVFLDAAAALVREAGPAAVVMSEVARKAHAPSGSLYHRFAGRADLLGCLWLRTTRRFHGALAHSLDLTADSSRSAVDAAVAVVTWTRSHYDDACVLDTGRRALEPHGWPTRVAEEIHAEETAWQAKLTSVITALHRAHAIPTGRATLAVVDLPYGAVHRYLASREPLPAGLETAVHDACTALLAPTTPSVAREQQPFE